jgi:insertion element IS1 protein InsB
MTTILAFLLYSFILLLSRLTRESIEPSPKICEEPLKRVCPTCNSEHEIKNGSTHNGKPKYQCKICSRQFVIGATKTTVLKETKQLIDRLLLERISLRGIASVAQVSWSWLQDYVNQKLAQTPRQVEALAKTPGKLLIECDEMWSFVDCKKNEVYIWLAIDRKSRKIVGCFVGDRTRKSARKLWASLPEIYQQRAFAYTDFWQAYKTVIPPKRHKAVAKETGLTNHIERLNNTFRQRVSRLVRESLSFSKKLNNHIGAVWYFIHGYNTELDRI